MNVLNIILSFSYHLNMCDSYHHNMLFRIISYDYSVQSLLLQKFFLSYYKMMT